MDSSRSKRIITGLALLAAAMPIIKGMQLLWDLVVLLILLSITAVLGLTACRSWKYRQSESGEKP
jgi:hypothetical protein